jgi:hypothetical protein
MIKAFINLFNEFWNARSRDIIVGCIGRIESFDKVKMRADIQPLLEYKISGQTNSVRFAVIGDVPVQFLHAGGFYIRPDYRQGDLVWVAYSTFSIEAGLNNIFDDVSTGTFSRESASVVAGIAPEKWTAPELFNKDGLIIGHKDGKVNLQVTEGGVNILGSVNIEGNVKVKGKIDLNGNMDVSGTVAAAEIEAAKEVSAMNMTMPVKLSTHQHPTAALGPPSPPAPGT